MQPRTQVEQLPRLDASELAWTGRLDRAWRAGGEDAEPWPCAQLAEAFGVAYSERRVAALMRIVATPPCPVRPDAFEIEIEFEVRESWLLGPDVQRVQERLQLVATAAPAGGSAAARAARGGRACTRVSSVVSGRVGRAGV